MKSELIIALFAILLAGVSAFAQSKDEETFKSLIKKMVDAQANYDPKALDEVFATDYIEISPKGEVDLRDQVLGFYKPEDKPPADKMTLMIEAGEHNIRNYGKFAIVVTKLDYKIVANGSPVPPRSIRCVVVFRLEKNSWKIASAQYTAIR